MASDNSRLQLKVNFQINKRTKSHKNRLESKIVAFIFSTDDFYEFFSPQKAPPIRENSHWKNHIQ